MDKNYPKRPFLTQLMEAMTTIDNLTLTANTKSLRRAYHGGCIDYVRPAVVGIVQDFKAGDIISCLAGHPHKEFAIIQLTTDVVDIDRLEYDHVTGNSSGQLLTSHFISYQWSLMEIVKPENLDLY
jgi:hypothetical protein